MESRNTLGIYLRRDRAVVVRVAVQGRDRKLLDCFSVSVEDQAEPSLQTLAERVGQVCAERKIRFADAAVALDCQLFMQHSVHSEFSDHKKIAATIRFDTEEALAADVTDLAVAFRVAGSDEEGSTLDVYTAQRSVLSDIILSLQGHGIDPMIVDPDVCCLARFLQEYRSTDGTAQQRPLYALLSDLRGYLVGIGGSADISTMRTFLVGPGQRREPLLAREILVTKALAEGAGAVDDLCVFDANGEVAAEPVAEKTGQDVKICSPVQMAGAESADLTDGSNPVDFALAYGAALGVPEKERSVNFRNDHMPYLGLRARRNNALKFLSIAVTILFLSVGVYFHTQLLKTNEDRKELRDNFETDYLTVMLGKKELPTTMRSAVNDLQRALRQVLAQKTGIGAEESISAKLVQVLQALNSCAAKTDLQLDSITVSTNSIQVNASTSSRTSTLSVLEAMKEAGLEVGNHRIAPEGGRTSFSVALEPRKQTARK